MQLFRINLCCVRELCHFRMFFPSGQAPICFWGCGRSVFCDELHVRFVEIQRAMHPVASARPFFVKEAVEHYSEASCFLRNNSTKPIIAQCGSKQKKSSSEGPMRQFVFKEWQLPKCVYQPKSSKRQGALREVSNANSKTEHQHRYMYNEQKTSGTYNKLQKPNNFRKIPV